MSVDLMGARAEAFASKRKLEIERQKTQTLIDVLVAIEDIAGSANSKADHEASRLEKIARLAKSAREVNR